MEIEDYIAQSRRAKEPPLGLPVGYYSNLYSALAQPETVCVDLPKLFVCYSTSRSCEQIQWQQTPYIIYDQHLGQTFNQLNRILNARTSDAPHAMAFACKVLAGFLTNHGALITALHCALLHRRLNNEVIVKGQGLKTGPASGMVRPMWTLAQELFILAHELSHHFVDSNPPLGLVDSVLGETRLSMGYDSSPEEALVQIKQRYGPIIAAEWQAEGPAALEANLAMFETHKEDLGEELLCDKLAIFLCFDPLLDQFKVPIQVAAEGLFLSMKFMRLLHHLESLAVHLAEIEQTGPGLLKDLNPQSLYDSMWGPGDAPRVMLASFRERRLRRQIALHCMAQEANPVSIQTNLSNLSDHFDQCLEDPILYELPSELADFARTQRKAIAAIIPKEAEKLLSLIDVLIGWRR